MVHTMVPTPMKYDNRCAHGIITGILKQKNLKVWTFDYTGSVIDPKNKNNSIHIGNAANKTYKNIQHKITQLNIIELLSHSM